jgi:RNA polymerase sigma-70 factor (ECF subfamily)
MAEVGTRYGAGGGGFPATRWSIVRDARDANSTDCRRSLETLASIYWRPVYAYLRSKWGRSIEDAKDLTQEFFVEMTRLNVLDRLDPASGSFRSYVRAMLDNVVRGEHRRATAQKRGGDRLHIAIDVEAGVEPATEGDADQVFQREWAGSLLRESLRVMKAEYRNRGADAAYEIFLSVVVEPPPEGPPEHKVLAEQFGVTLTDVRNALYRARKRFRQHVLDQVLETVTNDEEAAAEMRELFGEKGP